jgi:hypothetical protein
MRIAAMSALVLWRGVCVARIAGAETGAGFLVPLEALDTDAILATRTDATASHDVPDVPIRMAVAITNFEIVDMAHEKPFPCVKDSCGAAYLQRTCAIKAM